MADYNRFEYLRVSVKDRVATLTMNRPDALNAINHEMHTELEDVFHDMGRDSGIAAIVVTGEGRAFSAGGDMKMMANEGLINSSLASEDPARLIYGILGCPQPIIAAVNGAAVGLGATIALFCDVVIASDQSRFGDLHVRAGIVAGDGGSIIWPLLVGLNKAKELLMTADIIDAQEAYRLGVAQRLVSHDKLMEEAMGLATRLANGPLLAIRWTKQALNKLLWERTIQSIEYTGAMEMMSSQHADQKEASAAFVEKRQPKFKPTVD